MVKKIKISVKRPIGFRIADIGHGGKEFNVEEDAIFKRFRKSKKQF